MHALENINAAPSRTSIAMRVAAMAVTISGCAITTNFLIPKAGIESRWIAVAAGVCCCFISVSGALYFRRRSKPDIANLTSAIENVHRTLAGMRSKLDPDGPDLELPIRFSPIRPPAHSKSSPGRPVNAPQGTRGSSLTASLAENPRSTLIAGAPGSGKTTLLVELARVIVLTYEPEAISPVPLLVPLATWPAGQISLEKFLIREASIKYDIAERTVSHWLRCGNLLPLLDGFERVPEANKEKCLKAISEWINSSRRHSVIVTCRSGEHEAAARSLSIDQVTLVEPLQYADMAEYLQKLIKNSSNSIPKMALDHIFRSLSESSHLRNPLIYQLLAESLVSPWNFERYPCVDESTVAAFRLGEKYSARGEFTAARDAFATIWEVSGHSPLRAPAGVRLSIIQRQLGHMNNAYQIFRGAADLRLREIREEIVGGTIPSGLTETELLVLASMIPGVSYDMRQVSSRTMLTPSCTKLALDALHQKGRIKSWMPNNGRLSRFQLNTTSAARR